MIETAAVIVFVKTPRAGGVKTRMHTHLAPAAACDLYKALLRDTFSAVSDTEGFDLWLSIAPEDLDLKKIKKGKFIEEVLREADPKLFNQNKIQNLISGQRRGYNNAQRLFALTLFELWRREYRVGLPF